MMSSETLKIVFLDRDTLSPETVVRPPSFPHELVVYDRTKPEQVAERTADADIIITNKAPIRADTIANAKRLQMIAVAATGYDVVDVAAAKAKGVVVANIRNYAENTVPEHTFALMLSLRRSLPAYSQSVWDGAWKRADRFCYFDYPISNLAGATLGIIGDGVLGKAVADIGRAFGMKVLYSTYKGVEGMGPLYTPFEQLIAESDVITIHCPLMPSTRNLIGAAEFQAMKRSAILINTARGGLVDEAALCDAILEGQIGGAGFDVVTTEPLPDDHPFWRLAGLPNFILTPHVAWASQEAIQGLTDQLIDNIENFVSGNPSNAL
jgi:glycerate dehydrogenase